ncbi:MAG: helix-turn-helix domain-containing protein [Gammaproteobacteria bacterium]|nr:helix-turn-helix domain-containing protein [Gammaproteobacteria bacterium]
MTKKSVKAKTITKGSGNIFADLGLDSPEELKLKSTLTMTFNSIIRHRGLAQKDAAKLLVISQPEVLALSRGKLYHFSVEKLFKLLNALDRDVSIVIKKKPRSRDTRVKVVAA